SGEARAFPIAPIESSTLSRWFSEASPAAARNVIGVGIGSGRTRGEEPGASRIRLYVRKPPAPRDGPALPGAIGGVPTEVIVSGPVVAAGFWTPVARRRRRPARPGQSIGYFDPDRKTAGTLGALVESDGG